MSLHGQPPEVYRVIPISIFWEDKGPYYHSGSDDLREMGILPWVWFYFTFLGGKKKDYYHTMTQKV